MKIHIATERRIIAYFLLKTSQRLSIITIRTQGQKHRMDKVIFPPDKPALCHDFTTPGICISKLLLYPLQGIEIDGSDIRRRKFSPVIRL